MINTSAAARRRHPKSVRARSNMTVVMFRSYMVDEGDGRVKDRRKRTEIRNDDNNKKSNYRVNRFRGNIIIIMAADERILQWTFSAARA